MTLSRAPIDPASKLECVSYAPFRAGQSPLSPLTQVPAEQIARDLAQLAEISKCVRTYSVENGLDQVPGLAGKVGLKVIQGIWLGSNRLKNQAQISTAVTLVKEYPGVITSVVVGNEVLLRGEMTAADLVANIRAVKAQVSIPVTYADVWEYWLRNREVYDAVDFVTIHILPYWEDFPIRARYAAAHVDSIRKQVAVAFPAKEILIGETGWPSAGRMREGRVAVARQPGPRGVRNPGPGEKRRISRQPDRSLRPALEAPARGHCRRLLGADRRGSARAEISGRYRHQQFSVLEMADGDPGWACASWCSARRR